MFSGFYSFAGIRGKWGEHEYYLIQCPIKVASKILSFANSEVPENLRELQSTDSSEVRAISRRISANSNDYALNALVVVFNEVPSFDPIQADISDLGVLRISLETTLIICSGQDQQMAIRELLNNGEMSLEDTIPIVLIPDLGFERASNIYMHLNQANGNRSQKVLIENSDLSQLALYLTDVVPIFKDRIEKTRTTISNRSSSLFTLSAVHQATQALLGVTDEDNLNEHQERIANEYWAEMGQIIPEWQSIINGEVTASYLRQNFIHSHTVSLLAFGLAGNVLISQHPKDWKNRIQKLREIDWSRRNVTLWEGRAMVRGRMSKAHDSITLTVSVIKKALDLSLSDKEIELEQWISG